MAALTAAALAVIRTAYAAWWGPDPDPHGAYKHYAIDLFGMALHVLAAAVTVAVCRRLCGGCPPKPRVGDKISVEIIKADAVDAEAKLFIPDYSRGR
jgi:hypothetical protein